MTDKEELIKAAETFKKYCDHMQVFSHCGSCPLEYLCESINYHVLDKMSEFMKDVVHEVKYSDEC